MGAMALNLISLNAVDTKDSISITTSSIINVCTASKNSAGVVTLSFKEVNPYAGYDVQYFDAETNSIALRHEVISPKTEANRFETLIMSEDNDKTTRTSKNAIAGNTITNTLIVNKSDLLDAADLAKLDQNQEVKKTIVLFSLLNTTTQVGSELFYFGDVSFSGRNLTLVFTKKNKSYALKNILL